MHRSVILTEIALKHKRHFQISLKFGDNFQQEVKHVSTPISGLTSDAVSPPGIDAVGTVFLIVEKIVRIDSRDFIFVAEHQQSRASWAELSSLLILTHSSNSAHEHHIIFLVPKMILMCQVENITIRTDGIWAENGIIQLSQQCAVITDQRRVTNHQRHLIQRAVIVAFAVTAVTATARVTTHIHRPGGAFSTGDTNHNHILAFTFFNLNHRIREDIATHFLTVVDHIPKIFQQLMGVFKALYQQRAILALFHAEHDYTAIAVGESGICLPQGIGQTALSRLDFKPFSLTITFEVFYTECCWFLHFLLLLSQYAKLAKISDNSGIYRDKSVAFSAILIVNIETPERRDGWNLLSQSEALFGNGNAVSGVCRRLLYRRPHYLRLGAG